MFGALVFLLSLGARYDSLVKQKAEEAQKIISNPDLSSEEKKQAVENITEGTGIRGEDVYKQAQENLKPSQHYGSTIAPSEVKYYKDSKGTLTWTTGVAKAPQGFKEIDYSTYKAIERSKSGQPLGVKELETIAPETTPQFKAAREEVAKREALKPTMPSEIYYSLRQRQSDAAQKQKEQTGSWLVSEGVAKLYKDRQADIQKVLEREAQTKSMKQGLELSPQDVVIRAGIETGDIKTLKQVEKAYGKNPETFAEQKRMEDTKQLLIDRYKQIYQMKPSPEKFTQYYPAVFTRRKEFDTARSQLADEARFQGDKKTEWMLGVGAAPSTSKFVRDFTIGLAVSPAFKVAGAIPVVGKIVTSKAVGYGLLGAYTAGKGYEYAKGYAKNPALYSKPSKAAEFALQTATELGGFTVGYKTASQIPTAAKQTVTKAGIDYKLVGQKTVDGKTVKQYVVAADLSKYMKGEPITERVTVRTRGLLGNRDILAYVRKPGSFTGFKRPKFTFELTGDTVPLSEAVKIEKTGSFKNLFAEIGKSYKPEIEVYRYNEAGLYSNKPAERPPIVEVKKTGSFRDLFKQIGASYMEKPLSVEVQRSVKKKTPFVQVEGLGSLRQGITSQLATFKEAPISFEVSRYNPNGLYGYMPPASKMPFIETKGSFKEVFKDTFSKKNFGLGLEIESYRYAPKGLYGYQAPEKPYPFLEKTGSFKDLAKETFSKKNFGLGLEYEKYVYNKKGLYGYQAPGSNDLTLTIPKAYADVLRVEAGFPLKLEKASQFKNRFMDLKYAYFKPYNQGKVYGEADLPPEVEMYWKYPVIVGDTGFIRAISHPRRLVTDYGFTKIPNNRLIMLPSKKPATPQVFELPTDTFKGTEARSGRQSLILETVQEPPKEKTLRQELKQELKQEQLSEQVLLGKQRRALAIDSIQGKRFGMLSALMSGQSSSLRSALKIGSVKSQFPSFSELSDMERMQISQQQRGLSSAQLIDTTIGFKDINTVANLPKLDLRSDVIGKTKTKQDWYKETTPPKPGGGALWYNKKSAPVSELFSVFLKRQGQFKQVGEPLPYGRALRKGAKLTTGSLAATFKLVPTGRKSELSDISYNLNPLVFRGYKIKGGQKIPLENTFIQKAETRLGTQEEISEIQDALYTKRKRWF